MGDTKLGIMDTVLSKHVKLIQKYYDENTSSVQHLCEGFKFLDFTYNPPLVQSISDTKSADLRNEGNKYFKAGNYKQAQILYTQSIASAIGGPLAAMSFANRSAALFYMCLYEEALKDIPRSLVLGYTDKLKYKLHLREARCLKYLGRDWKGSFEEALLCIKSHNQDDVKKLMEVAEKEINQPAPVYLIEMPEANKWKLPPLSYGASSEVPSFSKAVSVSYSRDQGRHLVANRDIKTGDVLVVEESIVSALAPEVQWDYCHKCYKYCLSLIPCKMCGYVMYCGEECQDSDWNGSHKDSCYFTKCCYSDSMIEFGIKEIARLPGKIGVGGPMSCLMQRLLCQFGMKNLRDLVVQNKPLGSMENTDPRTKGFKDGKFTASLEAFLSIEDNFDRLSDEEMEQFCTSALGLASLHHIPNVELVPFSAFCLKMILILYYSYRLMLVFNTNYQKVGMPRIESGLAVYLAGSLINHSCDPNMYRVYYGRFAVSRAKRPIKKGQQLTECYHMSVMNNRFTDRQKYILQASKFVCKCEACEKTWPMLAQMPRLSLLNSDIAEMMRDAGLNFEDTSELKKFMYMLEFGISADRNILPVLVRLLEAMHKKNMRLNQWYFKLQESIKNYYRTEGNSFFFNDAKEILMGRKSFNGHEAFDQLQERLDRTAKYPGPFGTELCL